MSARIAADAEALPFPATLCSWPDAGHGRYGGPGPSNQNAA